MDIGLHTTVGVHTAVTPMEVDTGLGLRTLVCTCFTLVNILAEPCSQQLVALWAVTGESAWLVDTAVLAEVTGVAALIDIAAGEAIPVQLIALVTATQEGPIGVEAALLTWGSHVTLIHIHTRAVVRSQLEAWLTLASKRARQVHTSMLAIAVTTLIYVHTFGSNFSVTIRAGALVGARKVMAVLTRATVMQSLGTLVHIHTALLFIRLVALRARVWLLSMGRWRWRSFTMEITDDGSRARQTQITPVVVDAFHLTLASLRDGQALVDIPAVLAVCIPLIAICAFRVAVRLLGILWGRCSQEQQQKRPEQQRPGEAGGKREHPEVGI